VTMVDASHRLRRMTGRDPHEEHRVATPLELFFDLTFVVAFGAAGGELAHALAEDHVGAGLAAFTFVTFAICWAWINYTWFASAYDTDDWLFRILTMVQMVGVIILALGIPDVFSSVEHGDHLDNRVLIAGYIVMRVSMVGLWARVRTHDPDRRRCADDYIVSIVVGQAFWCLILVLELPVAQTFALMLVPLVIETSGPIVAEKVHGGTPWHSHHIAERYGLLVIITLGEAILGTVAAMSAYVHVDGVGWTLDAVVVLASGLVLTFGMWWAYFALPWGDMLHHHRERGFYWGYGHLVIFGAVTATGAGLHVAQYYLEHHSELGLTGTVLSVAIPVAVYAAAVYVMYWVSMRVFDTFHVALVVVTAAVLVAAVVLASSGASLPVCLAVVALAPLVTVVGYETVGHRHVIDHIDRLQR